MLAVGSSSSCHAPPGLIRFCGAGKGKPVAFAASAKATLATALDTLLRLFAPVLPFTTEEVWSWWQEGSLHRQSWPSADQISALAADDDPALIDDVAAVLTGVRKAKSEAKASMRADVTTATVTASAAQITRLAAAAGDIQAAGRIAELVFVDGSGPISVQAVLAEA